MTTTFRQNVVAGLVATLNTYKAAHPTLLRAVYSARPAGFSTGELPAAYVGDRPERVVHANGVRQRYLSPSVVVVDVVPDNEEALARMDVLIDGLSDAFTAAVHAAGSTSVIVHTAVNPYPIDEGGTVFVGEAFSFDETLIAEGRD